MVTSNPNVRWAVTPDGELGCPTEMRIMSFHKRNLLQIPITLVVQIVLHWHNTPARISQLTAFVVCGIPLCIADGRRYARRYVYVRSRAGVRRSPGARSW